MTEVFMLYICLFDKMKCIGKDTTILSNKLNFKINILYNV